MRFLKRDSKGQVLVLLALTMIMLLAVIALALDIGRAYGVKAKLNAAVDAASFEAANALAEGNDEPSMKQRADAVAKEFFAANYRLKFMGTEPPVPTVTAERDTMGKWKVRVAASTQMPTFFAGLIGFSKLNVSAVSETVRGTLDMVLVVDTSNSLSNNGQFDGVQERVKDFVSKFDPLDDRIGLVPFASGARPVLSLCGEKDPEQNPGPNSMNCGRGFTRDVLKGAINGLSPGGMTAAEEGLKKALGQFRALKQNHASGHRAIVFFSDGVPNTFNGKIPLTGGGFIEGNLYSGVRAADLPEDIYDPKEVNRYLEKRSDVNGVPPTDVEGAVSTESSLKKRTLTGLKIHPYVKCDANAAARNMAENVAFMARSEGIAVYSIGLGAEMNTSQMFDQNCSTFNEPGTLILRRLANTPDSDTYDPTQPTGIFCLATDVAGLKQCFDRVASAILRITR